jgi:hypothetical protein
MSLKTFQGQVGCMAIALFACTAVAADEPGPPEPRTVETAEPLWHDRYDVAWKQAEQQQRMMLIQFTAEKPTRIQQDLEKLIASDTKLQAKLANFVLAKLPLDATVVIGGQTQSVIGHPAFAEMHGYPGLAIIDLAHEGTPHFRRVVTAYPFMYGKYFRPQASHLPVLLNLPPGTITQRTMIWAVRVHPERPASTTGAVSPTLVDAANNQSRYQADVGVQGHHNWEGRFHRLRGVLGGNRTPVEVVAESWPSQTMIDSCIDCVASWRHSEGHWRAVRSNHRVFGYDIKRGRNGIWYGTGIFSN